MTSGDQLGDRRRREADAIFVISLGTPTRMIDSPE